MTLFGVYSLKKKFNMLNITKNWKYIVFVFNKIKLSDFCFTEETTLLKATWRSHELRGRFERRLILCFEHLRGDPEASSLERHYQPFMTKVNF